MSSGGILRFINRMWVFFEEQWVYKLLWLYAESTLLFLVLGLGIGSMLEPLGSMSYLRFLFGGFLFANVLYISFSESSFLFFRKIRHRKYAEGLNQLPISPREALAGELLWVMLKAFSGSFVLLLLALLMGILGVWNLLYFLTLILISSYLFSSLSLFICTLCRGGRDLYLWQFLLVMPQFFLSGIFFPAEQLPRAIFYGIYSQPLFHIANLGRFLLGGTPSKESFSVSTSVVILFFYFLILSYINISRIYRIKDVA